MRGSDDLRAEQALDECIDRIIRGDEWQSVLHRNPLVAADVRPLADLIERQLLQELARQAGGADRRWSKARIWERVRGRVRQRWHRRAYEGLRAQWRTWNQEAPALVGMVVTSAASSAGLLTALAAGVRSLP